MKITLSCIVVLGLTLAMAAPSLAGSRKHGEDRHPRTQHVPAGGDLVEWLFGGPRYYDREMIATAAEPCAYQRAGPDGNAVNSVNDHYCGK